MVDTTGWAWTIILLIILGLFFWIATWVGEASVQTYTPDGSHMGDFCVADMCYSIFHFIFGDQVDIAWTKPEGFAQYLLFPFLSIFVIMYAIYDEIKIFKWQHFSSVMALLTALITSSLGWTVRAIRGYLLMAGSFGIGGFGFILILGLIFWFAKRARGYGIPTGKLNAYQDRLDVSHSVQTALEQANNYESALPRLSGRTPEDAREFERRKKLAAHRMKAARLLNEGKYDEARTEMERYEDAMNS